MNLTLKIWRQAGPKARGEMVTYPVTDISADMSFLEMLDVLNEQLIARGEEPIAFDSDCREGICGMCGLMISGKAHGPEVTTTCQLHMRCFSDGDEITIEPWRADAFPVIKDLVVDRDSLRPHHPGGRLHQRQHRLGPRGALRAGAEAEGGPLLHGGGLHRLRRLRRRLPQRLRHALPRREDHPPRRAAPGPAGARRPRRRMVNQHDHEGFGGCTNIGECSPACPKEIPLDVINQLNKDLRHA